MTDEQIVALQQEIAELDYRFYLANARVEQAADRMAKASDELADARVERATLYGHQQALYARHIHVTTGRRVPPMLDAVQIAPGVWDATLPAGEGNAHAAIYSHFRTRFEAQQ